MELLNALSLGGNYVISRKDDATEITECEIQVYVSDDTEQPQISYRIEFYVNSETYRIDLDDDWIRRKGEVLSEFIATPISREY